VSDLILIVDGCVCMAPPSKAAPEASRMNQGPSLDQDFLAEASKPAVGHPSSSMIEKASGKVTRFGGEEGIKSIRFADGEMHPVLSGSVLVFGHRSCRVSYKIG